MMMAQVGVRHLALSTFVRRRIEFGYGMLSSRSIAVRPFTMLRFGILAADQFHPVPPGASRRHQAVSMEHVSLQLLRTHLPATASELTVFEAITKHLQFDGVYRTTYRGRLRDVDAVV